MKKIFGIATLLFITAGSLQAQTFGDIFNKVFGSDSKDSKSTSSNQTGNNNSGFYLNSIGSNEIATALRQALEKGTRNAASQLSVTNGYFGDALVKILLPPQAQKVETTLRQIGLGSLVDKMVLSMNRAAEDAASKAAPIFVNAITGMSIQDGVNIVRGGQGSATNYLKQRTTSALTNAFRPVIKTSLDKINAATLWEQVFSTYNRLPTTFNQINPDITAYVTERALDGMFSKIAVEENKIRANPAERTTDLLKKVFGAR